MKLPLEKIIPDDERAEKIISELMETAHTHKEKYVSPILLRKMYRDFCHWRRLVTTLQEDDGPWKRNLQRIKMGECDMIHYLLERCYWIRYGDSAVVTDLLQRLYRIDGHLGKIFDYQQLAIRPRKRRVDPDRNTLYLATTWSLGILSKENVNPVDYFIEHATKGKALFDGKRLEERCFVQGIQNYSRDLSEILLLPPCSRALMYPEVIIKLLQHGLFAISGRKEENIGKLLTGVLGFILCCSFNTPKSYIIRVIELGNVILRAIPSVHLPGLLKRQRTNKNLDVVRALVQSLSVHEYLPKFATRCFGPQELQHLCRMSIRGVLYLNWKLPHGISLLPLPPVMKDYINLQWG